MTDADADTARAALMSASPEAASDPFSNVVVKVVKPSEFLRLSSAGKIIASQIIAPRLGGSDFGRFRVVVHQPTKLTYVIRRK